ncbi:hypothetical protein BC938DRAFT_473656 [Jimgerdemannia flammicorona]|uniref:Uncharacterized protein n=1 Tax=Jimgerdemannia flammicorona TaxID=994334 RepID=A0A433Q3J6_9FUNG|nr:hypothetical protein BC938DRAFT_473656 [Jimgerdemannia flammicorona]
MGERGPGGAGGLPRGPVVISDLLSGGPMGFAQLTKRSDHTGVADGFVWGISGEVLKVRPVNVQRPIHFSPTPPAQNKVAAKHGKQKDKSEEWILAIRRTGECGHVCKREFFRRVLATQTIASFCDTGTMSRTSTTIIAGSVSKSSAITIQSAPFTSRLTLQYLSIVD